MNEKNQLSDHFNLLQKKVAELELELKEVRSFFNETEENGKIGGWQFDPISLKQIWTNEVFRILEIDMDHGAPEVPRGLEFIDPGFRPMAEKAIQRAMEFGEPYDQEWIVTTAKGNKKWVNAVCNPIMEKKKLKSISGSFQDISAKKKVEVELLKSEESLRLVLDNSPFPVAVVDEKDQNILYWSKSAVETFGHNPKTTEEWYELAYPDPDYRNKVLERWKPFIKLARDSAKAINTGEYKIICKDGSLKICALYVQLIPGSLIVTLDDITEKNKSEEQLRALNQQLMANEQQLRATNQQLKANEQHLKGANEQLVSSEKELRESKEIAERYLNIAAEIILSLDSKGNILMLNDSGYQLLGYRVGELTGKEWFSNCLPKEQEKKVRGVFRQIIKGEIGNVTYYESNIISKSGEVKTILWYNTVLKDKKGKITGTLSSGENITERVKTDKELKTANQQLLANEQELQAANQQLLANEQQLRAANQQLQANEQQLRAANQQLLANEQQLRAANQSLMVSNKRIHDLFNSMQEGFYLHSVVYDDQGKAINYRIIEANQISEKHLSIKKEDAIGKLATELFGTDEAPFLEVYTRVAETGEPVSFEQYFEPMRKHFLISAFSPKKGEFATVFIDITDKKIYEEEILNNQYYLKKAQEIGKVGTWELDLIKNQLIWTDENYKIFGVPLGTPMTYELFLECIHPDDRKYVNIEWNASLKSKIYDIEHRLLLGDKVKWVREKADFEFDKNGNVVKAIGFTQDITEQKQNENELQIAKEKAEESQNQLALIADNFVNGMIYQVAMLDEDRRQFNYISKNVTKLYGCTVEEAKEDANLIYGKLHPDDITGLLEKEKEALRSMSVFEAEARTITPDGKTRWAYYVSQPRIINGIVCWDGIEVDITDRKQMELELVKAKEKAEESDLLKSSFLANMSHEIRTPMNGILGFSNLLKEPELSGERQEEYISLIEKSGKRLLNTVNDLIDISIIESGQMKISVSEFDINELNADLFKFFEVEAKKKGLQLSLSRSSLTNDLILGDKDKINSILTNLINNAIKYTASGSINFGYQKKGDELQFFVKDSGDGIPEEKIEKVFNRFVRNELHEKEAIEGSGLGLSISKAYVEMLGGKIWLESEIGVGSEFYFTIPYKTAERKLSETEDADITSTIQIKDLKILIAEDDEMADNLLSIYLKKISKRILHTKSGVETIELCRNNPDLDLILMDIQMPGISGYEATKLIREFNKDVIIIAQTAFAMSGDREKSLEAGCNDYISKPIKQRELLKTIENNIINKT